MLSYFKGAIAEGDPDTVKAVVEFALTYLGLDDVTYEEGLDWANNFDWCAYEDKVNMCVAQFV